jgi:outer membrane immunogenic protein
MKNAFAFLLVALTLPLSAALAADLSGPSAVPSFEQVIPASTHDWTGAYVGAHVGGAWGDVDQRQTNGGMDEGPFSYSPDGIVFGGTAGYNFQFGNVVLGVEADLGYMDLNGSGTIPSSNPSAHQDLSLDGGLYGDVTARAGLAFNKVLVYGKGGFAFYDGGALQQTTNPGYTADGTSTFTGWTAGGGIEYAWTDNISLKIEYQHFDFGSQGGSQTSVSDAPIGYVYTNKTDLTSDAIRIGANYKF